MKRIAVVATVYRYLSHAQHLVDRFLVGYPRDGVWHRPDMKVVSLYVDQKPEGDQSTARAKEFDFQVYPTIAETLRCGGSRLAVDAVMVIGEHGDYKRNEKGQVLYPRYEFVKQCVEVFEKDGASVPLYNDKHLSYSFEKAQWMVEASKRLKFPMLAGSSLPVTWRLPDVEIPLNAEIESALMVGYGGADVMDFHGLEALQCMVERRKGGESGVAAVQMVKGDAVWQAGAAGRYSKELLVSALSRSDSPQGQTVVDGRTQDLVAKGELPKLVKDPAAYFIEYRDGLKATLLMLNGAVKDFHVRRTYQRSGCAIYAVLPVARTERHVFSVPRPENRRVVRDGQGTVPGRAHAAGERHTRELSDVSLQRTDEAGDAAPRCAISCTAGLAAYEELRNAEW